MSVGKRISDTIEKMDVADSEGALFQISAAIEITAKKEYGKSGHENYKDFIHQNMGLITDIAFGGRKILNINLKYDHPGLKKTANGLVPIQDIFYHVVRCGLYHEAALPDNLKFTNEMQIRIEENGMLVLPSALIYGLICAVVVSPVNHDERVLKEATLNLGEFPILINKLWGRRNELLWLLDAANELMRLHNAAKEA
jgi:hypothetical protein